MLWIKIAVN